MYQFATTQGTPQRFVDYLKNVDSSAYKALSGKPPGSAAFDSAWKQLSSNNKNFAQYQHDFTKKQYYDPAVQSVFKNIGLDVERRPQAVKDAIWSTAVQHGVGSVSKILKSAGVSPMMSDAEIIKRLYAERGANNGMKYFSKSSSSVRNSVVNRFKNEQKDALSMLS
jgi:hypothetical protein